MKQTVRNFCIIASGVGAMVILTAQAPPAPQQPPTSTEFEIKTTIRGEPGAPPHYAVPDFIALTNDKETADAARLIAQVLWDDLSFEREFDMIPRDTYRTIETTPTTDTIAFDRWRELGANGVIKGSVRKTGNTFQRASARCRPRPRLRQCVTQKSAHRLPHHVRRDPSDTGEPARRCTHETHVRV
jgi:TolB-like protein